MAGKSAKEGETLTDDYSKEHSSAGLALGSRAQYYNLPVFASLQYLLLHCY